MNLREFLRGGYQSLDDITVVSNHGRPVFTVHPHTGTPGNGNVPVGSAPPTVKVNWSELPATAAPKSAHKRTRRT